jgi:ATP-dependent DNA helicase RecG
MIKLEVLELIAGGEDSFVEFKADVSQRSDFAGEIIAFANTEGGKILVGVDDDGQVVGMSDPAATEQTLINLCRHNCVPPIDPLLEKVEVNGKTILVLHVPRRPGRPYENDSGQCFLRVGSSRRLATPEERARLLQRAGMVHFEETPVSGTGIEDLDMDAFGEYYRLVFEAPLEEAEIPLPKMLENMRLLVEDLQGLKRLSVAGLLLFGKRPQDRLYHSRLSAVRFVGKQAGEDIADRQEILGRLPQLIGQAEAFLARNTRLAAHIQGFQREDFPEYPREALREAVVSAIAHRDYSLTGSQIRIFIFDDRIEVYSPGRLPNTVTLENIRTHYSVSRNPLIARVLFNLRYMSALGTGIPRIIRLMKEGTGREPDFEVQGEQFSVRLWGREPGES